jgi:hypothetical protein
VVHLLIEGEEEEADEEGVMALDLVVIVILRLMESEEGMEGSVAVDLMVAVCLVEEREYGRLDRPRP